MSVEGSARAASSARSLRALAAALVAMTAVAYLPVLENGFIWDDGDYVYENPTLTSAAGLSRIWLEVGAIPQYYPLVHTSYWLEYRMWGLAPLGYHVVNVLLHAVAVVLLWRVLAALAVPGAFWAAAVFALHPLHVESVAWITERKNVLCGVLYFASFLAYLRWVGWDRADAERSSERLYAVSLLCFFGALLSKTVAASLPAVLLVVHWWKDRPIDRRVLAALAPYFLVGIGFGLFTSSYETQLVGASGAVWDLSPPERVLVAGRALWFYLAKLLWPHPLSFNYPRWAIDAGAAFQYLYPLAAIALAGGLWGARRRIGRGALAAALIFAGSLAPALGFFNVYPMRYSFVADHFCYLASAAPIALGVGVVAHLVGRAAPRSVRPASVAAAGILIVLATLSWQQVTVYRDAETLWRATLRVNPDSWLAHSHLCAIEQERGAFDRALRHCREILRLEPDNHETHHMFAILEVSRGEVSAGIRHYRRALEIEPDFIHSQNGLGAALNLQGNPRQAIPHFQRALARHPDYAEGHTNYANALAALGDLAEAERHHRRALALDPELAAAHNNLASVLLERGEYDLAREHLARVVELTPDSAEARHKLRRVDALIRRQPRPSTGPK